MRRIFSYALMACAAVFIAFAGDANAQSPPAAPPNLPPSQEQATANAEATFLLAKATLFKGRSLKSAACECESCRCVDCVCESQQRFANDRATKIFEAAKIDLKAVPAPPVIQTAPTKTTAEPPPISKAGEPKFSADKRTLTYDDGRTFTLRSDGTYWPATVASSSVSTAPCVNGQCPLR